MEHIAQEISCLTYAIREATEQRKIEFEWTKSHLHLATVEDLEKAVKQIMAMTEQQLEEALDKMTAQTGKIAKEQSDRFDALTKTIDDLNAAIAAGGAVSPAVEAKQAALQVALDNLDAAIPDAPTP